MEPLNRDQRITAVASLDQPLRRQLYEFLADRTDWLTRDEAADTLDVARSVAAFHLDKLADAGVLEVSFERTTGRTGPGAGRPSKRYRLAVDELSASLPDRRYDLAGHLLAQAVAESTARGTPVGDCLSQGARAAGRAMGGAARSESEHNEAGHQAAVMDVLEASGYEPRLVDDEEIVLGNCPFHRLAEEHRALVCGMNLDLLDGVVDGLRVGADLEARLEPEPGLCCVRLRRR